MSKIKFAVIKETKTPPDRRTPLTPKTAKKLLENFPEAEVFIQKSNLRAFKDEEYQAVGLPLTDEVSNCDILMGVKEVKIGTFVPEKTYMIFAHVAKKQEHNKELLKEMIRQKITLIDYEYLTDENNRRLVAFGYWAGVVGAYNGMRAWGLKFKEFNIPPAHTFHDKKQMYGHIKNIRPKPMKIVITGGGRVATGAAETLQNFGIKEVIPELFLIEKFDYPVFTRLDPAHYVRHKEGKEFDLWHFFKHPEEYVSTFEPYTRIADMYIAAHFWNPLSPKFITREMVENPKFNIKVIADISCDVDNGPIATTIRASSIAEPFYDYNPKTHKEEPPFSSPENITVMAVDNLPGELPRDASEAFSEALVEKVIPAFFNGDKDGILQRATILKNGKLTEKFAYLNEWVNS